MKVLITGSSGMLATDLIRELEGACELYTPAEQDLNICDFATVQSTVRNIGPDVVVNCAAFTDVDGCETKREQAFAVNAMGAKNISLACRDNQSVLYHVSTDFVFDGKQDVPYKETDAEQPLSVYGLSKLKGEQHVRKILDRYAIVRTSWLFGESGNNFVKTILRLLEEKEEISVVHDQTGSPTYTVDLARAIKELIRLSARGVFHVCNAGACTWYEFAVKIRELSGKPVPIVPITTDQMDRPAQRPAYSVLDCGKFAQTTGEHMRFWEDALNEYMRSQ